MKRVDPKLNEYERLLKERYRLTDAQARILAAVNMKGEKCYNRIAERAVTHLEKAELIKVQRDWWTSTEGPRVTFVCTPHKGRG